MVAMLTDRTKAEILADVGTPEKPDYFWLNYMQALGFVVEDVRDDMGFDRTLAWKTMFNGYLNLPLGSRYYCSLRTAEAVHAVAVDESAMVFDPSTSAPMLGTCTLNEYLRLNRKKFDSISIGCYRVRRRTAQEADAFRTSPVKHQ
ncbi:MAG TPA: hypothetical protein VGU63_09000 [Candidatus Acidoferrales bacterium]|nr:hypothetical protein [Candidatus Acidoferrales bacterium]